MSDAKVDNLDMNQIKEIISSKENEIKDILMKKIAGLQTELHNKGKENEKIQNELNTIKEAYGTNLKLLEERDNDLKSYEEKFDSIEKVINIKENENKQLKDTINDLNTKLKYEKAQKTKSEEYNKFSLSKINLKHQEEIKILTNEKESMKKKLDEQILKYMELSSSIQKMQKQFDNDKKNYNDIIQSQNIEKDHLTSTISKQKNEINDLNFQISKLNNENISQLKEKMAIEAKIKTYESKEQEHQTNLSLCNQKNKFIQAELDQTKKELNSILVKNENLINQNNDLKNEVFTLKQTIQMKDFEIEKEKFSSKLLNEKISNLSDTVDKLLNEKSTHDNTTNNKIQVYTSQIDKLTQENNSLKKEIDSLNTKIKELANVNIKDSYTKRDKQIDDSVVDFFNNNNNTISPKQSQDIQTITELKTQLNQKEIEIQRLKSEYESNEANYLQEIENYKTREQSLTEEATQYRSIVSNLEQKVEELDKLYIEEKTKIKNELTEKVTKLKKENKKIKEERDKLVTLCEELKIEVNRLENNLSITQNIIYNSNMEYPVDDEFNLDNIYSANNKL